MRTTVLLTAAVALSACATYQPIVDPQSKYTVSDMAYLPQHLRECRALASGTTETVTDAMGNVTIGAAAGATIAYAGASSISIPALSIGSGPIAPFVLAGALIGLGLSESEAETEAPMVAECLKGRGYGVIGMKRTYEVAE